MSTSPPLSYARLPTYSAVIDCLASGLGVARNKEDSLSDLGSFSRRIDMYSGMPQHSGLQDQLLDLMAGSSKELRSLIRKRLLDAEKVLTDERSIPLLSEATESEGLRCFIESCAVPWFAQILDDAYKYPMSTLGRARQLLREHTKLPTGNTGSYLETWKTAIKKEIPKGVNASEFRLMLARLDQRSQRKHSSIEQDLVNLRTEMQSVLSSSQELDAAVDAIRGLYLAGMATMRLSAMAAEIIPEQNILSLLANNLSADTDEQKEGYVPHKKKQNSLSKYRHYLTPNSTLLKEYNNLYSMLENVDVANFDKLRAHLSEVDPLGLLQFVVNYMEGLWHLRHGQNEIAKQYLQKVVEEANHRQLGEIAAFAASLLIAQRLRESAPLKFEMLNPLMRVRIDNIPQVTELILVGLPTPFSDWSPRPEPSFYDSHVMECVRFFNDRIDVVAAGAICNPLQYFDKSLREMLSKSLEFGASLARAKRQRSAIIGTSIKPYQVLRNHSYYRYALFGSNLANLPAMDDYANLKPREQRFLLRFVDPEQYQFDLQAHNLCPPHDSGDLGYDDFYAEFLGLPSSLSPSQDSVQFGYDKFYAKYLGKECLRGLIELSRTEVIPPSKFSIHDPRHLCLAAFHGYIIYPIDEHEIEAFLANDSISKRMDDFRVAAAKFNAEQELLARYRSSSSTIDIDDDEPFTLEQFERRGLGDSDISKAALQYERDRKYSKLARLERLNHFAQEFGFANIEELKIFLDRLNDEAQAIGYESYATICNATRFMDYLGRKNVEKANMTPALDALHRNRAVLQQRSAFIIDRFLACRTLGVHEPYFIDVNGKDVMIELFEGRFAGTGER